MGKILQDCGLHVLYQRQPLCLVSKGQVNSILQHVPH